MDREQIKGALKDTAGKLKGDNGLRAEGKLDKVKGDAHNVSGDAEDAARAAATAAERKWREH